MHNTSRLRLVVNEDCVSGFVDSDGNDYPLPGEGLIEEAVGEILEEYLCDRIYEGPCITDPLLCEAPEEPLACESRDFVSLSSGSSGDGVIHVQRQDATQLVSLRITQQEHTRIKLARRESQAVHNRGEVSEPLHWSCALRGWLQTATDG